MFAPRYAFRCLGYHNDNPLGYCCAARKSGNLRVEEQPSMVIDADAHVVETAHTWDYLDGSEKKYRPQLFQSAENPNAQYWFLDGKNIGFRNATLSEQELIALSKATGRTLQTAADARELRDVELRLQHMDALGIDVQILFNTMWIARVADKAEAEIALCR